MMSEGSRVEGSKTYSDKIYPGFKNSIILGLENNEAYFSFTKWLLHCTFPKHNSYTADEFKNLPHSPHLSWDLLKLNSLTEFWNSYFSYIKLNKIDKFKGIK